jgi:hypothetical protein
LFGAATRSESSRDSQQHRHARPTRRARARSSTAMLEADDKFFCNSCRCLQEAQWRMKIKTLPRVLCLHLKRFKYIEQLDRCAPRCSTNDACKSKAWSAGLLIKCEQLY